MSERKSQQELDFERKHEEDLQRLRGLRLIDDDFMAAVFEERACAEFLLQIILKRDDLTVKEVHGQYSFINVIINYSITEFGCKINLNHEKTQKVLSKNDLALCILKKSH